MENIKMTITKGSIFNSNRLIFSYPEELTLKNVVKNVVKKCKIEINKDKKCIMIRNPKTLIINRKIKGSGEN